MSDFPTVSQNVQLNTDAPAQSANAFFQSFNQQFKQARTAKLVQAAQTGDHNAWKELYSINPELAMQMHKDQKAEDEEHAAGAYLVASNGNDPAVKAAIAAGANPKDIALLQTRNTRITTGDVKNLQSLNNYAMQKLGSVRDQAGYDAVRADVRNEYSRLGYPVDWMDDLPTTYSPEVVAQLQQRGMSANQQYQGHINQQRVDETGRHNVVTEGQGQQRVDETGRHNQVTEGQGQQRVGIAQQNADTSAGRADESVRHNQATEGNTVRGQDIQAATTRGSASYQGKGHHHGGAAPAAGGSIPEGTVARNKQNGKMYVRRGGQWVPQ
ncbi:MULTISPECIES: hypothetical protein [Sphingomonas]|uniref:hypothetical protein n=1 Tax=Sphingomonas TaxID=13687 RepID=UPI00126A2BE1|nr:MULTISPECIES: hypothetical protein [Sphingomonas]